MQEKEKNHQQPNHPNHGQDSSHGKGHPGNPGHSPDHGRPVQPHRSSSQSLTGVPNR